MKNTYWLASLAGAATLAIAPCAMADVVTLSNGDRLTGKVLNLGADALEIETAYAGKLKVKRGEIARIVTDQQVQVLLQGADSLEGASGEIALGRVAFVNPTPEQSGIGVAYSGRATLSAAQVRGNSSSSTAVVDAVMQARARDYRWELGASAAQASESGVETASKWRAQASRDWFVAPKRFVYVRGAVERDRFSGVQLRSSAGVGYGVQLVETEGTKLSLRGGIEAVSVDAVEGPDDRYPAAGWGVRYSQQVLSKRAEVFHEQDGYWNLESSSDITVRSRTGLRVPLVEGLTASAQWNVDWSREPEPGRSATDSTLLVGLGYAW